MRRFFSPFLLGVSVLIVSAGVAGSAVAGTTTGGTTGTTPASSLCWWRRRTRC